jgi:hypothetical protein
MRLFNKLFGRAHSRLLGMLVLMSEEPRNASELCERLLDLPASSPTSKLYGKPRRFGVDNKTWYEFVKTAKGPELIEVLGRILSDTASDNDYLVFSQFTEELCRLRETVAAGVELNLGEFNYDSQPGWLICAWDSAPLHRDHCLTCRGCGQAFDFAAGSGMVTDEDIEQTFLSAGQSVIKHPSRLDHPDPDLVIVQSEGPKNRGIPPYVIKSLRLGKYRRWRCQQCNYVQGYPGSLFLP